MSEARTRTEAPPCPGAVILAAGRGMRMRPLTDVAPKPLLEAGGRPLITYGLAALRAAGIEEVVVNVHHLGERLEQRLGDGAQLGMKLRYSHESVLLDTGGGIRQAAGLLAPCPVTGGQRDPIVVLNGDVVTEVPIAEVMRFHHERDALVTLVLRDDPAAARYGLFGIDAHGRVQRFLGTNLAGYGGESLREYMFASVQVLSARLIDRMPPERPFSSMHDLYPRLFAEGEPFYGFVYPGRWRTADTPAELAALDEELRRAGLPSYMI